MGVAPLQGLADLGSWRSGGMGGDPPARVQLGGSDGPRARGHWWRRDEAVRVRWDGLLGQERPDSAQRITTAAMPISAILRSTGSFSPPTLRRLPATRSLSAGWWCLPAVGQDRSGPHAPRPVEQRHPDPPPTASFPGQAVPTDELHPCGIAYVEAEGAYWLPVSGSSGSFGFVYYQVLEEERLVLIVAYTWWR